MITGTVTYGNAIGSPVPPRYVSGVQVDGTGSPSVSDTTGALGGYSLTGFGSGAYTITASKSGGINGSISSFDAAKISQYVSGAASLSPAQQIVADVSGTGGISSFDAALIARYAAALGPPTGSTGMWISDPVNYVHSSVSGALTDDFSALLMGEVSGNWTDTASHPFGGNDAGEEGIEVFSATATAANGELAVPVMVRGAEDKGMISYEFDLRYDPSVIQPQAQPVDLAGTVSRGLIAVVNSSQPGLLKVVVYGPMPIDADGLLLNVKMTVIGSAGQTSPLIFERIMFNEGERGTLVTDGSVTIQSAE